MSACDLKPLHVLGLCLQHLAHLDESNAAIHCGLVRYSPLTFRVAETIFDGIGAALETPPLPRWQADLLEEVLSHKGHYDEDSGR